VFHHVVFFMIFFKIICQFYFFNIELVENYSYGFSHKTPWIAIMFPHMVFFVFYDFFQNYICRFYFFNIELVKNLTL